MNPTLPLHPVIRAALDAGTGLPPLESLPLPLARATAKARYTSTLPPPVVDEVRDIAIPGPASTLAARVYTPAGPGPFPLVVFFHGSGFVLLDLDTHDRICRQLCRASEALVVSVDYRLAPEHPFPAAPDDCLAAARWVGAQAAALGGDPARIALAGDSAGACLVAATALRCRDEGGPALRGQLHFYPVTDYPEPPTASQLAFAEGYGLTRSCLQWYWRQYLPDPSLAARASPLRAASCAGLPPALILPAEYDVLRDEGEHWGARLREAGVPAEVERCPGLNHGFLKYVGTIDEATRAMDRAGGWLRAIFATP